MKFRVKRNELFRHLQTLQNVTERKPTLPILSQVLLRATAKPDAGGSGGGKLEMTATDSEVTVVTNCPAEVSRDGVSTLMGRKLFEIARLLPEEEVSFDLQESKGMAIQCRESRFQIRGSSPEDFPRVAKVPEGEAIPFDISVLQSMIRRVDFATTSEDSRYVYSGALLLMRGKELDMVATDGHRLSLVTATEDTWLAESWKGEREMKIILPKKILSELGRVGGNGDSVMNFWRADNHLFFRIGNWSLVGNAVEGSFAPYEKVIPKGNQKRVQVRTTDLLESVRRVGLLSGERSSLIEFGIRPGKLELSSRDPSLGEAREVMDAVYSGDPLKIGFNARYLSDFLGVVGSESIRIDLQDAQAAGIFSPADDRSPLKYTYVVMPMHFGKNDQ